MNFSPRKQTFFHCFFFCARSSPPGGVCGEGDGGEEQGQTTAGNFNFWLFGDPNLQGDEWVIQTRYLLHTGFLGLDWG